MMWAPFKKKVLDEVDAKISIPNGKQYCIGYTRNLQDLGLGYFIAYSVRNSLASVHFETFGGEPAKEAIEAILAKAPADHLIRQAEMSQGKRNKNKWQWGITKTIDRQDSSLIQWYVDTFLAMYKFMEQ